MGLFKVLKGLYEVKLLRGKQLDSEYFSIESDRKEGNELHCTSYFTEEENKLNNNCAVESEMQDIYPNWGFDGNDDNIHLDEIHIQDKPNQRLNMSKKEKKTHELI